MSQIDLCGADTLVRETLEARTDKGKASAIRAFIAQPFTVLVAALREIFDESAYERFLARQRIQSSPDAYGDFLRESEAARARRPKCC